MTETDKTHKKLNVCAYCRVSTGNDDQANSFENQCRYFKDYIEKQETWKFVGIFADNGFSGTATESRSEFQKMISASQRGEIDIILTKEVSRFSRNLLDTISFTRQLKQYGVSVIFICDSINTADADAELRLSIMASLAQEESRKTSERVKWGQQRMMEKGVVFGKSLLGYDVFDGRISVNEGGAKIVRMIFHKYIYEGKSAKTISEELNKEKIHTLNGSSFSASSVKKILKNEKYCGDLIQKKTYTPDFLTHKKKYNYDKESLIILRNHHQPIISRDEWDSAAHELKKRARKKAFETCISSCHPFSGRIRCKTHGSVFIARRKKGCGALAWRCGGAMYKTCSERENCFFFGQKENTFFSGAILEKIKASGIETENIASEIYGILKAYCQNKNDANNVKFEKLNDKKVRLLALYLDGIIDKESYSEEKSHIETAQKQYMPSDFQEESISFREVSELTENILNGSVYLDIFNRAVTKEIYVQMDGSCDIIFNEM